MAHRFKGRRSERHLHHNALKLGVYIIVKRKVDRTLSNPSMGAAQLKNILSILIEHSLVHI